MFKTVCSQIYVKVASLGGSSIPVEMLVKINNGGTNETILIDAAHDVFVSIYCDNSEKTHMQF